jgi:hypothetical protein
MMYYFIDSEGARGSVVGSGTMTQAGRSQVRNPMGWIFFNWPNPSSRTTAVGSTQPLTEMSTRKLPGIKERAARKADNRTTICEPIFLKKFGSLDVSQPYGPTGNIYISCIAEFLEMWI